MTSSRPRRTLLSNSNSSNTNNSQLEFSLFDDSFKPSSSSSSSLSPAALSETSSSTSYIPKRRLRHSRGATTSTLSSNSIGKAANAAIENDENMNSDDSFDEFTCSFDFRLGVSSSGTTDKSSKKRSTIREPAPSINSTLYRPAPLSESNFLFTKVRETPRKSLTPAITHPSSIKANIPILRQVEQRPELTQPQQPQPQPQQSHQQKQHKSSSILQEANAENAFDWNLETDYRLVEQDEVFGFGSFEKCFVTEEDLKRAREKLPEDEVKTPEEATLELLNKLQLFNVVNHCKNDQSSYTDIILCCNHVTLGVGSLFLDDKIVCWEGDIIKPQASNNQLVETQCYAFSRADLSDIREKSIGDDEHPLVMLTIQNSLFIQFGFPKDQRTLALDCANRIKTPLISTALRNVTSTEAAPSPRRASLVKPAGICLEADMERLENYYALLRFDVELKREELIRIANEKYEEEMCTLDRQFDNERDKISERYSKVISGDSEEMGVVEADAEKVSTPCLTESSQQPMEAKECELCFNNMESKELVPCGHRLCVECFQRLMDSFEEMKNDEKRKEKWDGVYRCPWDRREWTQVKLIDKL